MGSYRITLAAALLMALFSAVNVHAVQDTVMIQSLAFMPDTITVNQGDSVVWFNNDGVPHTSTSDSSLWDSGTMNPGESFTLAFDSAGTFPYHCAIHTFMLGTVEVLPVVVPDVDVEVGDFYFDPAVIQIDSGQTVRWTNISSIIHTSTAVDGLWDSGDLGQNEFFDFTFDTTGVFHYICIYHSEIMKGTVIVGTPDSIYADITIDDFFFDPDDITVPVGSYVRWINFGTVIHNVVDTTAGYFSSGDLEPGDTFTLFADSVDDFFYLCTYHPTQMTGALHVYDTTSSGGCDYVIGDVNGSDNYNGLDITYGVSFLKGGPDPHCPFGSCSTPPCDAFFYCGDVNGSCNYNGLDITYGVSYLKGGSAPVGCPTCPPNP